MNKTKTKTRIKITLPVIGSRQDAEETMNSLAQLVNEKRSVTAEMDARLLVIANDYETMLADLDKGIEADRLALQAWAEANPEEFPKGRKSIEFLSGILGFRTGTHKLALVSRAWTWEKVLVAVKNRLPGFVRIKEEVDRESLLAKREDPEIGPQLASVGVKAVQDESFYVEPKLTEVESN